MNVPFSAVRAILRKRDGGIHPEGEIAAIVSGLLDGSVADYQITAWMMAVFFRGMTREETAELTRAMLRSGRLLPPWEEGPPVVDKHSTGGVGDKISLTAAPIAAACGLRIPMISGRALGHTGGTLDKLESIPGYRVGLEPEAFRMIVRQVGMSIAGASQDLVPADRKMYALRDVAGIIESPPLIVSSILSKKAAARLDGLVLDVKVGRGGFNRTPSEAGALARMLIDAGVDLGMRVEALLTWMGDPLGSAVGNALEILESIRFLRGEEAAPDLEEASLAVASSMLRVGDVAPADDVAIRARVLDAWRSGRALERFAAMIAAHGGDPRVTEDPDRLPRTPFVHAVEAPEDGWVDSIDARSIGEIVIDLGGGRRRVGDTVDPRVGVVLHARVGDRVASGASIADLYLPAQGPAGALAERLRAAYRIVPHEPQVRPIVLDRLA